MTDRKSYCIHCILKALIIFFNGNKELTKKRLFVSVNVIVFNLTSFVKMIIAR